MPYVNKPRPYKKEYKQQIARGEGEADGRRARERARDLYDREGIDRDGKDIDHKKPLRSGGSKGINNLRVREKSANRADNGHKKGETQNKGSWK